MNKTIQALLTTLTAITLSCESFDNILAIFEPAPPAQPLNYREVLDNDHPIRLALEERTPPSTAFKAAYEPDQTYEIPGVNGLLVTIPPGALDIPPGEEFTILLTQPMDAFEIASTGQSLWIDSRTVMESGGMAQVLMVDSSGLPISTKREGIEIDFPQINTNRGMELWNNASGQWESEGKLQTFVSEDQTPIDVEEDLVGFFRQTDDGLEPAPLFLYKSLKDVFYSVHPHKPMYGKFYLEELRMNSQNVRTSFPEARGSYVFFQAPGEQVSTVSWNMNVRARSFQEFPPSPQEAEFQSRINSLTAQIRSNTTIRAELDAQMSALVQESPWQMTWNCDIPNRFNVTVVNIEAFVQSITTDFTMVYAFNFGLQENTFWELSKNLTIPLANDRTNTLVLTSADGMVYIVRDLSYQVDVDEFSYNSVEFYTPEAFRESEFWAILGPLDLDESQRTYLRAEINRIQRNNLEAIQDQKRLLYALGR